MDGQEKSEDLSLKPAKAEEGADVIAEEEHKADKKVNRINFSVVSG